jgi:hypothetical protein
MGRMKRRIFLKGAVAAPVSSGPAIAAETKVEAKVALGYDNFAVRAMGWKAPELIVYAAKL